MGDTSGSGDLDLEVKSVLNKMSPDAECPPLFVQQLLEGLDDDPEPKPEVRSITDTAATPSADSGFGGGGSPPPGTHSTPPSSNGGDSPAPLFSEMDKKAAHRFSAGSSVVTGKPFTSGLDPNPQQPSENMDMRMLQQAIALVQMGVDSSSLDSVGPAGDCSAYDPGFQVSSNFANNLKALAQMNEPHYSPEQPKYSQDNNYRRYFSEERPRYDDFKKSFRGSNNSLASSGDGWPQSGFLNGLSRLEINKGGLGKNPYAGLLTNMPGLSSRPMYVRCKFGQLGHGEGQFNSPHGFCLGLREEIIVADTHNHRIQIFDKDGQFRFMFGNQGKAEGCLWYPRKVAVLRHNGNFVVCDRGGERSRMQIFNQYGQFSHAISIRFIDIVAGLAINHEGHIVAVDSVTPTIFVLSEMGELIKFHECSDFMKEPSDIGIYDRNYYICDFKDHNVVVVSEEGKLLRKIGNDHVTCFPNGIDISDAGDVLIGDSHGNKFHVGVYDKDANYASQFECPHVKVSRCCGLKITSEGYIVTLAKNNHHVLVLDTIYIS